MASVNRDGNAFRGQPRFGRHETVENPVARHTFGCDRMALVDVRTIVNAPREQRGTYYKLVVTKS